MQFACPPILFRLVLVTFDLALSLFDFLFCLLFRLRNCCLLLCLYFCIFLFFSSTPHLLYTAIGASIAIICCFNICTLLPFIGATLIFFSPRNFGQLLYDFSPKSLNSARHAHTTARRSHAQISLIGK